MNQILLFVLSLHKTPSKFHPFAMNSQRRLSRLSLPVIALTFGLQSAQAVNIASQGTGIVGVNGAIDSTLGTPYAHAGLTTYVNDGAATPVDTWNGDQPTNATAHVSYVGVTFATPRTDFVGSLTLNSASFFDGGWFGPNNSGPGASQPLNATYIITPTVQITFDGGTTWSTVASTSNYSTVMNGVVLPVAFGAPTLSTTTFTLTSPVTGIRGIRLIGSEGGTASGGFLGLTELGVDATAVPEPGTFALLGSTVLLLTRRRKSNVRA
jgi:hypothetical protein